MNRLFLESKNTTPDNTVLSFNSETAVANHYGAASTEASLAKEFFAGYAGTSATMMFTRIGLGQRPHLLGANISDLTLAELQAIDGSLALTFDGYSYSGNVNLTGVTSFRDAANAIRVALNSNREIVAETTGSSITPESVSFTGYLDKAQLHVTSVSSGSLIVGGMVFGPEGRINQTDRAKTRPEGIHKQPTPY